MKRISLLMIMFLAAVFTGCELGMTDYYDELTQPPAYSVIYDANGADSGLPPVDSTGYREGDTVTVKGNDGNLVKSEYHFSGWDTDPNGGTTYTQGKTFILVTKQKTLYARWTKNTVYYIEYLPNGGSGSAPEDLTGYEAGWPVTIPGPGSLTRNGYSFTGWNKASDGSGDNYKEGSQYTMGSADVTLYANWDSGISYSVYYSPGDPEPGVTVTGSEPVDSTNHKYGDTVTVLVNMNSLAHINYNLAGWNYNNNGTILQLVSGNTFIMPEKNVVLNARWSAKACTVTFNAQGGSTPDPQTKPVTYNSNYGTLATTSRSGYSLGGWFTGTGGSGIRIEAGSPVRNSSNHTVYASWVPYTYTITIDFQGSPDTNSTRQVAYNTQYGTLPTPTARTGYVFGGWYTGAMGTGTRIYANTPMTTASNHTLYAYWPDQYSVGSTGPGGGTIFYLNPGFANDKWRYLEAAPDIITNYSWSPSATAVTGADGTAIGTGLQNTIDIVSHYGTGSNYAARYCRTYSRNGYTDWFLPSRGELDVMINTIWQALRTGCCNLVLTSTEYDSYDAVIFYEVDENPVFGHEPKTSTSTRKFRPVRRF